MINFVFKKQPKGYQGSKTFKNKGAKDNYISELKKSYILYNPTMTVMTEDLYGLVYYFQKKKTGTDADNISKPIWDCLKEILFIDDKQVKFRIAGIIDISHDDLSSIDFTNVRGEIVADLFEAFEQTDHFTYIECGELNNTMYKFNIQ